MYTNGANKSEESERGCWQKGAGVKSVRKYQSQAVHPC